MGTLVDFVWLYYNFLNEITIVYPLVLKVHHVLKFYIVSWYINPIHVSYLGLKLFYNNHLYFQSWICHIVLLVIYMCPTVFIWNKFQWTQILSARCVCIQLSNYAWHRFVQVFEIYYHISYNFPFTLWLLTTPPDILRYNCHFHKKKSCFSFLNLKFPKIICYSVHSEMRQNEHHSGFYYHHLHIPLFVQHRNQFHQGE